MSRHDPSSIEVQRLHPGAVAANLWHGCVHPETGKWRPGLLCETLSRFGSDRCGFGGAHFKTSSAPRWVVFDGALDATWFDDVRSTLHAGYGTAHGDAAHWTDVSGQTILLRSRTRVIMECDSVSHASPALLAALPIIFCRPTGTEWHALVTSWLTQSRVTLPALRRVLDELTGMLALLLPALVPWVCGAVEEERACGAFGSDGAGCAKSSIAGLTSVKFTASFLSHLSAALAPFKPLTGSALAKRVAARAAELKRGASLSLISEMKKPLALSWETKDARRHVQGITSKDNVLSLCSMLQRALLTNMSPIGIVI